MKINVASEVLASLNQLSAGKPIDLRMLFSMPDGPTRNISMNRSPLATPGMITGR